MSEMLFYDRIEVLDTEKHKNVKVAPISEFSFAATVNSIPVAGVEFIEASKEYPIAFVKNSVGDFVPMIIVGLQGKQNLFVSQDGMWNAYYIPAYVRRYPFVPATTNEEGTLNICVDASYAGFDVETGELIFNDDGSPAPMLDKSIKLIQDFHASMKHTSDFCKRLAATGILEEMNGEFGNKEGEQFRLTGLYVINEEKLLNLSEKEVLELFRKGEFAWIYSHLTSLSNFPVMVNRFFSVRRASQEQVETKH